MIYNQQSLGDRGHFRYFCLIEFWPNQFAKRLQVSFSQGKASQMAKQTELTSPHFTFKMCSLDDLSSGDTYKRMKTELLYWPRNVASVCRRLNFLSDHTPSGPIFDSRTGQRKGECRRMCSNGFASAFSIASEREQTWRESSNCKLDH